MRGREAMGSDRPWAGSQVTGTETVGCWPVLVARGHGYGITIGVIGWESAEDRPWNDPQDVGCHTVEGTGPQEGCVTSSGLGAPLQPFLTLVQGSPFLLITLSSKVTSSQRSTLTVH